MTPLQKKNKQSKLSNKKRPFIPPFYDVKINFFGKDNYKFVGNKFYISALLKTVLHDFKNFSHTDGESLGKRIREKVDSNGRLLIKKGTEKSVEVSISSRKFVLVNINFDILDENTIRIHNDSYHKFSKFI